MSPDIPSAMSPAVHSWGLAPGAMPYTGTGLVPEAGKSRGNEGGYPPTLHRSILPDPPVARSLPSAESAMSEIPT